MYTWKSRFPSTVLYIYSSVGNRIRKGELFKSLWARLLGPGEDISRKILETETLVTLSLGLLTITLPSLSIFAAISLLSNSQLLLHVNWNELYVLFELHKSGEFIVFLYSS
jgi:hypothetical protein